eukprot:4774381-Amphidinium_carterae.1
MFQQENHSVSITHSARSSHGKEEGMPALDVDGGVCTLRPKVPTVPFQRRRSESSYANSNLC